MSAQKSDDTNGVEAYLSAQELLQRQRLEEVRTIIHAIVPEVEEKMSYGILGFFYRGKALVYAGGWETYVSIYPIPEAVADLKELQTYQKGKGTLRFPNGQPLPTQFIQEVIAGHLARVS
jgi:uncharacterized protein YdhG (YjbR/CyaY superfamily)